MKKTLSVILAALMMLSMLTCFVSAAGTPDYAAAKDGDVLYTVDFSGTDGIYKPVRFRYANTAINDKASVEVKDGGKTLVGSLASDATAAAWFFGGKINGLTVGPDKAYTMTMKVAFPTGNAGVYFNIADVNETADPTKDTTYNSMYGLYGQIKSGNCMTMSWGAGGKFTAEKVSSADAYTPLPEGVANDADGFVTVTIKIDGDFYSVWFNDKLYDQSYVSDSAYKICPNLGFTLYLYNKGATCTVKDVVITKGCDYKKTNSVRPRTTDVKYEDFALGQKIGDLNFASKSGIYAPYQFQNAKPESLKLEISADGKTITMTDDDTTAGNAHWFGGEIGNLKITDSTKYTIVCKEKDTGNGYAGCIGLNGVRFALNAANRYNWYGGLTSTSIEKPITKFAYNGTNFTGYNYTDDNMKAFAAIKPTVDADGYTEIVYELNGWKWTIYLHDANQSDKLVAVQTVDVKKLAEEQNHPIAAGDNLSFLLYTYNKSVSLSVKDAAVYKGLTVSETYPDPTTPPTGDYMIWVVVAAIVSVLGMGIAVKAKNN